MNKRRQQYILQKAFIWMCGVKSMVNISMLTIPHKVSASCRLAMRVSVCVHCDTKRSQQYWSRVHQCCLSVVGNC